MVIAMRDEEFSLSFGFLTSIIDFLSTHVDGEAAEALNFLLAFLSNEDEAVFEHGKDLLIKLNNGIPSPAVNLLSSLYAYHYYNDEVAAMWSAIAYARDPTIRVAALALTAFLKFLQAQEDTEGYIILVAKVSETLALSRYYWLIANHYLICNEYEKMDHYLQRAHAVANPWSSKDHDITQLRSIVHNGIYEKEIIESGEWRKLHYNDYTSQLAKEDYNRWLVEDENKKFLAQLTAAHLQKDHRLLELGSHAGALLSLVDSYSDGRATLYGIEPDLTMVDMCRKKYPYTIHHGNHTNLADMLPVDILLCSCVLLLLQPQEARTVMEYASHNVRTLIIMDDAANMMGAVPIPRRFYILHPYKKLFDEYGFALTNKYQPPNPNSAISAVMVAVNQKGDTHDLL